MVPMSLCIITEYLCINFVVAFMVNVRAVNYSGGFLLLIINYCKIPYITDNFLIIGLTILCTVSMTQFVCVVG